MLKILSFNNMTAVLDNSQVFDGDVANRLLSGHVYTGRHILAMGYEMPWLVPALTSNNVRGETFPRHAVITRNLGLKGKAEAFVGLPLTENVINRSDSLAEALYLVVGRDDIHVLG